MKKLLRVPPRLIMIVLISKTWRVVFSGSGFLGISFDFFEYGLIVLENGLEM